MDRLGRNADDVIMELKTLKQQEIRVIALDVPFMNDYQKVNDDGLYNMIIDIFITLKAHMAEQEKEKNHERIMQGIETARTKGIKLGRPSAELSPDFLKEYKKFKNGQYGEITATQFAKMQGIARSTLYKYMARMERAE